MNQYLVNIVFRIESPVERIAQFDEQFYLVQAGTATAAYEKALLRAQAEEGSVNNINGIVLQWKFVGITRLTQLKNISGTEEILSNTRETHLPQAYVDHIKEKHEALISSLNQPNKLQVHCTH